MAILNYLRNMLKKGQRPAPKPVEYIQEARCDDDVTDTKKRPESCLREMEHEIDLSPQQNLEDYARGLSVTKESIERWISSGLLMPDEMKVAEKIIKIMRKS